MVDAGCAVRGDVHAARRRDGGAGGAADDPAGSELGLYRSRVGDRCVRAVAGQRDSDLRCAGGQVRTKAGVHRRRGGVHRSIVRLRAGSDDGRPDLVARPPGAGRWCDVRHQSGADRADLPGPRPRTRDRRVGVDRRRGGGHRAAGRRPSDRHSGMAVDLLRERADRHRDSRAGRLQDGQHRRSGCQAPGHRRPGDLRGSAVPDDPGALAGE